MKRGIESLPPNLSGKPLNQDMTALVFGHRGTKTEHQRYYYVPNGMGVKREQAIIACTVLGAVGPFTMSREVTYGDWVLDINDERRDERLK